MNGIYQDIGLASDTSETQGHLEDFVDHYVASTERGYLLSLHEQHDVVVLVWSGMIPYRWSRAGRAAMPDGSAVNIISRLERKARSAH